METLLTFGVGVDTSAAEAGLASLGGSAEGVAAGLEDRLASASDGMKDLGKQSSQASRGIQGLASVVSLVDPRLGQVVRSVGTLARGLSVLRLGLGPAAAAVTVVTGALYLYQKEQQRAKDEMEAAEARADRFAEALQGVATAARSIEDQIRLVNGEVDQFGLAAEQQSSAVRSASDSLVQSYDEQIKASKERISSLREEVRSGKNVSAELRAERKNLSELTGARSMEIDRAQRQIDTIELMADFYRENRAAAEAEAEASRQAAEQARRNAEARRQQAEALAEVERQQRQLASMVSEVAALEKAAANSLLSDEERIISSMNDRLARLQEIAQTTQGYVDTERAENAIRMQAAQQLTELDQQRHEAKMAQIAREKDAQRQATQDQIRMATDLAGTTSQFIAMGFKDKQAAQVAEGTSAAILAGINTIASNPTPLGIAQAGLNVALAMAQVAKMRSVQPSFHRGGFGDEFTANMRRGEAVLSTQGRQMMGDEAIRRANRGQAPQEGGGVIEVRQFYRHRPFDEFARDNLERGGPVTSAINGSRQGRSYHRSNRNGA